MEEPLQKSLERYDVLDRIAVGGMAEVFLAKAYGAHGFEKTLAIKRILPELARDPEFAARFIAEAKVAVKLSHANVVQVFDFGRIGESLFIAMEYVDGLDLAAMLHKYKSEKRLVPLPAAFHIAIEIVRALDFAHSHNVVHRDVSPSNILISRAGEVKIADFGIAVAAQPYRDSGSTSPKRVMGKWRYMSPEQTRGDTLDTRSDLFSAASVMFELFTGEKLFPGDEAEDIIKNIHDMPIPRAGSIRPGLPSRLEEILAGPLARKPIDRPSRPAVVLRSLIELSYESSIMATALDVADAIATLIPAARKSGPGTQLDDVIRKQLGDKQEEKSVARRTAVTSGKPPTTQTLEGTNNEATSTGLFRKLDIDGVSRLEELEVETDPTSIKSISVRRDSEGAIVPSESGLNALYDARRDPDRHTEVGGPPTGQVAKAGDSLFLTRGKTKPPPPKSRAGLYGVIAVLALGLGAGGVYMLTRPPDKPDDKLIVAPTPPDAAPAPVVAEWVLEIDSIPPKSMITVGDQPPTPSPVRVDGLKVGTKVHFKIEHKGYKTKEDDITAEGRNMLLRQPLEPAPAKLHVITNPVGASVTVADRHLGETPNTFEFSDPRPNVPVTITKAGFMPLTFKVDLKPGETFEVKRDLKPETRVGFLILVLRGKVTNAEVFEGGTDLGHDQTIQTGRKRFRLAIGHHRLHLTNGANERDVDVDIVEGKVDKPQELEVLFE